MDKSYETLLGRVGGNGSRINSVFFAVALMQIAIWSLTLMRYPALLSRPKP